MEQESNKIGFLVLPSIGETLELIAKQDEQKAWKAYHALYEYATKGKEPQKDAPFEVQIVFTSNRDIIDNAKKRFIACSNNGKKGGRPKKNKVTEDENTNEKKDEPPKEDILLLDFEQNTDFSELAKGLQMDCAFINSLWDKFKTEVQFKQKVHHDLNDIRGHFISWVEKHTKAQTASANEVYVTQPNKENEYFLSLENSDTFNRLANIYNVAECYIKDYYKRFKSECELSHKTHSNKDDLQSHFVRWLSIKFQNNKEQFEKAQNDKMFAEYVQRKMQETDNNEVLPFE